MTKCWKSIHVSYLFIVLMTISGVNNTTGHAETDTPTGEQGFHFRGIESTTTESFTVEDGWKVRWETEGPSFQLSAYGVITPLYEGQITKPEQIVRSFEIFQPIILANSSNASGTAFHRRGGTFYLNVTTSGPWTIHITTIETTIDYLDVPYTGAP